MSNYTDHNDDSKPPHKFTLVTLRSGPHDGQTVCVPSNLGVLKSFLGPNEHVYHRRGASLEFIHESQLQDEIGGGA